MYHSAKPATAGFFSIREADVMQTTAWQPIKSLLFQKSSDKFIFVKNDIKKGEKYV